MCEACGQRKGQKRPHINETKPNIAMEKTENRDRSPPRNGSDGCSTPRGKRNLKMYEPDAVREFQVAKLSGEGRSL